MNHIDSRRLYMAKSGHFRPCKLLNMEERLAHIEFTRCGRKKKVSKELIVP